MKKSELRKYISEALTPDEASKVEPKYKETYAAMIRGKGPLKLKKYDNPDKVVLGRVINNLKESTRRTNEKLDIAIKEVFSEKQRKYMCVMAQPGAKRPKGLSKADAKEMCADTKISKKVNEDNLDEEISNVAFQKHANRVEDLLRQLISATKAVDSSQDDTEDDVEELDQSIDYLASALTDKDPIDIAVDQATFGRLAKPTKEEKTLEEIDNLMNETGQEIAKKNMDDYKRLNELVKAALMGPIKEGREYDADAMEALGFDLYPGGRYEAFKYATEELGLSANEILGKLSDDDVYNAIHHSLQIMGMYDMDDAEELEEKQVSTDKYDKNPALTGKQSELPDSLQKAIIKKAGGKVEEDKMTPEERALDRKIRRAYGLDKGAPDPDMPHFKNIFKDDAITIPNLKEEDVDESFKSLSKKIDKQKGKSKKDADNIAGYIANIKRKGGGKGPTAKQKARMKEEILKELRK